MGPIVQCFGIAESEYPIITVNVCYVMGFRPNYFTCIVYLYLYYTLLVPYTYASYIKALMYILSL